jgi:2-methylcitrate dehydratase PrpD
MSAVNCETDERRRRWRMQPDGPVTIAQRVAEYIAAEHNLPDSLLDRARLHALDTIGAMIGATATATGQKILAFVESRGAPGKATTIGLGRQLRTEDSALANATLAHTLEFDDGHRPSDNHLGCVVVPSALVMAEETGATWGECLESIVIGYDVMGRAGEATLLPRNVSCFHGTGSTGVFGSAAVAAMMLGLDADRTAQALAIAGTAAAGLRESMNNGPECKPLHAGRAAANGIDAAYLAELGYTGPLTIFEGTFGFTNAMVEQPRPHLMIDGLGQRYSLTEAGFKVHSTCGMLFNILDGVLLARNEFQLNENLPDTIRIGAPSWLVEDPPFRRERPRTTGEARFSIPFAVAAGIVDGEVSLRQMAQEKLNDPRIAEVEKRVLIDYDREVEQIYQATKDDAFFYYPASIEFELDGTKHRSLHTNPRGYDPTIPLTPDEVVAKFLSTVAGRLPDSDASKLIDLVLNGEKADEVHDIARVIGLGSE